ncbi:MAG: carbohydrate ABC transporter permease [Candidatus Hydrogenedentes bacterium]|nr:carbohydrate ABC transporter permease [Candidatus Hydrogenedentota bacterium]
MARRGTSGFRVYRYVNRVLGHAVLMLVALLFLLPFYWMLSSAFKEPGHIFAAPPQWIPSPWHPSNFRDVLDLANVDFIRSFVNSLFISVSHCGLVLFLCSLAGFAFAKYRDAPGRQSLFVFVLGTMMIPGSVLIIPIYVMMVKLGGIDTYWAMIVPGAANAFGIYWMREYIGENVHDDLLEAARIDGCSELGIYWHVVLPVIRPALAALGVFTFIFAWNNLMGSLILLHTKEMYTLPLVIYLLNGDSSIPYGIVMAASLLATAPLILAFLFFQRDFVEGMTSGALKA